MTEELGILASGVLAACLVLAATPMAARIAIRYSLYDVPVGWKEHQRPTPYLGGAAVVSGLVLSALLTGHDFARIAPILGGAVALSIVGTLDDRVGLRWLDRVALEGGAAVLLWAAGLGWSLGVGAGVDLLITIAWVVGVINAVNLIDLMDGVAGGLSSAAAAAAGALALIEGDLVLAGLAFGLCGACLGYLPYNLARPAKIFLGDGGSMPVGFVLAALVIALPLGPGLGLLAPLVGVLLLGVPLLDMCFRIALRRRRGISLLTGGPDSLANRLFELIPSRRAVTAALALVQVALGAVAIGLADASSLEAIVVTSALAATGAASAITLQRLASRQTRRTEMVAPDGAAEPAREAA